MIRRVIQIDEEKCNGWICVTACHEGAIGMVDGKARLMRDDYCDGLGDCLPNCPTGDQFYRKRSCGIWWGSSKANMERKETHKAAGREAFQEEVSRETVQSQLQQWPCQIKLVLLMAPYFEDAKLLIAADCTAYAYKCAWGVHERKNNIDRCVLN